MGDCLSRRKFASGWNRCVERSVKRQPCWGAIDLLDGEQAGRRREILLRGGERLVHVAIECLADIGNVLIDALLMRDPASYVDIIDVLRDEEVVSRDTAAAASGENSRQDGSWMPLRRVLAAFRPRLSERQRHP